jgi:hypothetical protein
LNGGPNGGGGIQGNLASSTFGSLVPIINDPVSGNPLAENLQAGTRYLWNPRTIQMTAKYTF